MPPHQPRGKIFAYLIAGFIAVFSSLALRRIPFEHGIGILRLMGFALLISFAFIACMAIASRGEQTRRPSAMPAPQVLFPGIIAFLVIAVLASLLTLRK